MAPHHIAVLLAALTTGCVGTMEEKYPSEIAGGGPDAGAGACDEPMVSGHDGKHYPGEACLSCHADGASAPPFTIGGTLYVDLAGSAPLPDATIHIIDAEGTDIVLPVAANGNFWSTETLAYPVSTYASLCPDSREMITPLDPSGGDCNMAGCHTAGFRVALP